MSILHLMVYIIYTPSPLPPGYKMDLRWLTPEYKNRTYSFRFMMTVNIKKYFKDETFFPSNSYVHEIKKRLLEIRLIHFQKDVAETGTPAHLHHTAL